MASERAEQTVITVPSVSGEEAARAIDLVEELKAKHGLSTADLDQLFGAVVAIYIRERLVHGDRQPSYCGFAGLCGTEGGEQGS